MYTTIVALVLAVLAGVGIVWHYTKENWRQMWPWTLIVIGGGFVANIVPIALLIIDISNGTSHGSADKPSGYNALKVVWSAVFWITQVLSWVLLPMFQEYALAGDFTFGGKVLRAAKENIKLYIAVGAVLALLLVYIAFTQKLDSEAVTHLAIGASNAFGMILIILFMGYGLAQIPRTLWFSASRPNLLSKLRRRAASHHEVLETSRLKWYDVRQIVENIHEKHRGEEKVDFLMALVQSAHEEATKAGAFGQRATPPPRSRAGAYLESDDEMQNIDLQSNKGLVKLHAKVKSIRDNLNTVSYQWQLLVDNVLFLEEIEKMAETGVSSSLPLPTRLKFLYFVHVHGKLLRVAAVLTALFSAAFIWSESVALPFDAPKLSIIKYLIVDAGEKAQGVQQVALLIVLPYVASAAYWSLFRLKVFEFNLLVPHHSSPACLCFTATFLCRLILPLCYNFLNIAHLTSEGTGIAYSAAYGKMDTVAIGRHFNRYMPCLLALVSFAVLLDILPKLLRSCGIATLTDGEGSGDLDQLQEGRDLIQRERLARDQRAVVPMTQQGHQQLSDEIEGP